MILPARPVHKYEDSDWEFGCPISAITQKKYSLIHEGFVRLRHYWMFPYIITGDHPIALCAKPLRPWVLRASVAALLLIVIGC
jgi:hypothetical protein